MFLAGYLIRELTYIFILLRLDYYNVLVFGTVKENYKLKLIMFLLARRQFDSRTILPH
jgi:hypothetical protein